RVVEMMDALGLLAKIEPHSHAVPHAQRGAAVVEPWLTDQWYVDTAALAGRAIAAVESGATRFVPKSWEKTYFDWMRNIQPWCISRQLWWGHQIPAWYGRKRSDTARSPAPRGAGQESALFVAQSEADAIAAAKRYYGSEAVNVVANEQEARAFRAAASGAG